MIDDWVRHKPLVAFHANRVARTSGYDPEELIVAGMFGLYLAAKRFDPERRRVAFTTFASRNIVREMIEWMRMFRPRRRGRLKTAPLNDRRDLMSTDRGFANVDARDECEALIDRLSGTGHAKEAELLACMWDRDCGHCEAAGHIGINRKTALARMNSARQLARESAA